LNSRNSDHSEVFVASLCCSSDPHFRASEEEAVNHFQSQSQSFPFHHVQPYVSTASAASLGDDVHSLFPLLFIQSNDDPEVNLLLYFLIT
jgi:hypothetical protein